MVRNTLLNGSAKTPCLESSALLVALNAFSQSDRSILWNESQEGINLIDFFHGDNLGSNCQSIYLLAFFSNYSEAHFVKTQ